MPFRDKQDMGKRDKEGRHNNNPSSYLWVCDSSGQRKTIHVSITRGSKTCAYTACVVYTVCVLCHCVTPTDVWTVTRGRWHTVAVQLQWRKEGGSEVRDIARVVFWALGRLMKARTHTSPSIPYIHKNICIYIETDRQTYRQTLSDS